MTTERYDSQTIENLQIAAGKLEFGKVFEPPATNAEPDRQVLVKNGVGSAPLTSRIEDAPGGSSR